MYANKKKYSDLGCVPIIFVYKYYKLLSNIILLCDNMKILSDYSYFVFTYKDLVLIW